MIRILHFLSREEARHLTLEEINHQLEALKVYLELKKIPAEQAKLLLEYGKGIIQEKLRSKRSSATL